MKPTMKPRERVLAALNHQEPDRVPLDLGQAAGDGITAVAYQNLLSHLGLGGRSLNIANKEMQLVTVDEDVLQRLGIDFRVIRPNAPDHGGDRDLSANSFQDQWGMVRVRPADGFYFDFTTSPFAEDASLAAITRYPWPDPEDPGRYRGLREKARRLRQETDYALVLDADCTFFDGCGMLRGWEDFYSDLLINREFAEALMDRYLEIKLAMARHLLEEMGEFADVVVCSRDDLGSTQGPIISPNLFRELVLPRMRGIFEQARRYTDAKLLHHCDGAIVPFLEDLIGAGVQITNPVQVNAAGMGDTANLKRQFGDRLVFWGAIDTSEVLPRGSVEDVRQEVRRRIADLAPGGGYVLCSVHNFQPDVPPENVVATFDAAREFGVYQ
ncbi:MAG: uroporphyrinogen decarboxylase family protein [Chloroflexota bacterium]